MDIKPGMSLRYKLLILLVSLPMVTLVAYLVLAIHLFETDKIAYVFDSSSTVTNSLATQVTSEVNALISGLKPVLEGYSFTTHSFDETAKGLFQKDKTLDTITIFKPEAGISYKEEAKLEKTPLSENWLYVQQNFLNDLLKGANEGGVTMRTWESTKDTLIAVAIRHGQIDDPSRHVSVSVRQAINFLEVFKKSKVYSTYLTEKTGTIILAPSENTLLSFSGWDYFLDIIAKNVPAGTGEAKSPDGKEVLASFAKVSIGSLYVISFIKKSLALSAITVLIAKSILFFIALISLATITSVFASRGLTAKLRDLADATKRVAEGYFDINVEVTSRDEVGVLASGFNRMAAEVARLMQETASKARMEKELETAKTVQETLFPESNYQSGTVAVSGHYQPASECGGDWWNYCEIGGKLYLWIGDATGHGAPAALITSAAKSAAAIIERLPPMGPGKILELMNRAVYETSKGRMLMTFFLACLDKQTGALTYSNASHEPAFQIKRKEGRPIAKEDMLPLADVTSPRLGDNPDSKYPEASAQLEPGDVILFYTDGVVDQENPEGKIWGERKLVRSMQSAMAGKSNALEIATQMKTDGNDYRQGSELKDDVTFFICTYG